MDINDLLRSAVESQPWWKKYSNTITTVYFTLLHLAWLTLGLGTELPEPVVYSITAVIAVGNILGIKGTKNGIPDDIADQVQVQLDEYVGKHRRAD